MVPMAAEAVHERLALALDPAWLVAQRWFRAKRRAVDEVRPQDVVAIPGTDGWLAVVAVRYADGGSDRYLLPMMAVDDSFREPLDGEGLWRAVAEHILGGRELSGMRGTFAFEATRAGARLLHDLGPAASRERRLGVEQSNTSVVLGERLILKLYRLLEAGTNPDVEVSAFLTDVGFAHTPALAGSAAYLPDDGASCAAAALTELVPAAGDGWAWALRTLSVREGREPALAGVRRIGEITAALHAALASRPEHPDFPARTASRTEAAAWHAAAVAQLDGALAALDDHDVQRLERVAPALRDRLAVLAEAGGTQVSRIHGDFHLGQLLPTDDDFAVIDFEGEPARPLAQRREPSSPLRDVAGMLRSLDYAARTVASRDAGGDGWEEWLAAARATFLDAYGSPGGHDEGLLTAFELEKACYEVGYEANNRPAWTWLPLDALERSVA